MTQLGNGLFEAKQLTAALTVKETELATMRRLGADEEHTLVVQGNLANVYLLLHPVSYTHLTLPTILLV